MIGSSLGIIIIVIFLLQVFYLVVCHLQLITHLIGKIQEALMLVLCMQCVEGTMFAL